MFDAIEDIPSGVLVAELLSRRSSDLSTVLVEIADEMRKGDDADIRWLQGHATYVEMGAAILQVFSPAVNTNKEDLADV